MTRETGLSVILIGILTGAAITKWALHIDPTPSLILGAVVCAALIVRGFCK